MCDTDPLALRSARENFRLNNESFSEIWEGSAERSSRRYDLVVANIIADVLRAIASQLKEKVAPNGILILSGILDRKESMVADAFSEFALLERKQRDEWIRLILSKSHQGDISAAETDSASV
jgi:ribosomal protein L11 methyltransferase